MVRGWLRLGLAPAAVSLASIGCVTPGQWWAGDTPPSVSATVAAQAAAPAARAADDLSPDQALQLCITVARQMDRAGNDQGALENWEKVQKMDPTNLVAARRLCVLYDRTCQFSKAEAEYRKLAKANPKDADLLNDWGYSLYLRNNWDEAESKLRQALEIDGKNARAHCNLGLVLGQKGQPEQALKEFAAAGLGEAEARCNLAFAYWSQGQLELAKEQCRQAAKVDGACARAREMLEQLDLPPRPKTDATAQASLDKGPARPARRPETAKERSASRASSLSDTAWAAERVKAAKAVSDLYGPGAADPAAPTLNLPAAAPAPVAPPVVPPVVPPELKNLGWSPMIRPAGSAP